MSIFDNKMNTNPKEIDQTIKAINGTSKKITNNYNEEFGDEYPRDFKEQFDDGLLNQSSQFSTQSYSKAGVTFEKISDTQAKVNYNGLLAKNGANQVFGVYGFGSNNSWENVSTLSFTKNPDGTFNSIIPVEYGKNVNLAFKDAAENWDNNSGMNYTFVN